MCGRGDGPATRSLREQGEQAADVEQREQDDRLDVDQSEQQAHRDHAQRTRPPGEHVSNDASEQPLFADAGDDGDDDKDRGDHRRVVGLQQGHQVGGVVRDALGEGWGEIGEDRERAGAKNSERDADQRTGCQPSGIPLTERCLNPAEAGHDPGGSAGGEEGGEPDPDERLRVAKREMKGDEQPHREDHGGGGEDAAEVLGVWGRHLKICSVYCERGRMAVTEHISARGVRVHNLQGVDLTLPKRKLVVFTGVSGSGKSSMAFDTLFAEGQRRYVESLSVYARQFLGQLARPDCDALEGLSPTISIEQKSISHNPRSTVGTITEVLDHLRVLYAQLGVQHCSSCGDEVRRADEDAIVASLDALPEGTRYLVLAPLVANRKGEFRELFEKLRRQGFTRARIDGEVLELDGVDKLRKSYRHTIEVVVDRLSSGSKRATRVREAVSRALSLGEGSLRVQFDSGEDAGTERYYSERSWCATCDLSFPELTHQSFSFNSPIGMCEGCRGLGTEWRMDPDKVVPDPGLSINGGCFAPLRKQATKEERWNHRVLEAYCDTHGISRREPWESLSSTERDRLLNGAEAVETLVVKGRKFPTRIRYEGVLPYLMRRLDEADTDAKKERFSAYLSTSRCGVCDGQRLRPESAAVAFSGIRLGDLCSRSITDAAAAMDAVTLTGRDAAIGDELLKEVRDRLSFLQRVGLGYLSLDRSGPTLSGGEAQRIRLASQLGSRLTGVLYVLDEPSIGLHQRDNDRLIGTLETLRDQGNSVLVVEHDRDTIEAADFVADFGPGAGALGGALTYAGPPSGLHEAPDSVTGAYLCGRERIEVPATRRVPERGAITVYGARANNLKDIDVAFPIGLFICVTGVSGAGKSTLINEILYPAIANHLYKEIRDVALHRRIDGLDKVDKVVRINQQPIGRTPRSNPATYIKVFDDIRRFFSELPDAKIYGYTPGRFSFNVAGGRCEACQGGGVRRIEMSFLADVFVECEVCRGRRFNDATLRVRYRGHSIHDVLSMSFDAAAELFDAHPRIRRMLQTVIDVGLGYITLGQPAPTMSGGEAQRVKLSRELAKIATGDTLYILDEPSTGLHFEDIRKLLVVLQRLTDAGNTVVVIEHNLDIVKAADHVIDIGPDGGSAGGQVVAVGTPEEVAASKLGHTAAYLARELGERAALGRN